jgi:sugar/nucleoside kinase (ribokinase family)
MDNHSAPALTIVGDVGVDVVLGPIERWPAVGTETLMERSELRAGGSAGNAALAAGFLGAPCRLVSLVGNDGLGAWLAEQFHGFEASLPVCDHATSVSVGIIHACGERTFFTTRGHLEAFAYEHVRPSLTRARRRHSIALLSGVFLTPKLRQSYGRLIEEVAALGYEVALDTGWPSENWSDELRGEVFGWAAKCDHVLLNEIELASLAQQKNDGAALRDVGGRLKPGATLVVKNGARGAVGWRNGSIVSAEAIPSTVFDTIGAGDSFNAGYLVACASGRDLGESLEAGCRAAASVITRFPRREIKRGELRDQLDWPTQRIGQKIVQGGGGG